MIRALLAGLVEDQGGDAREVTLMLRRNKRQALNSKRRAKEAEGSGGGASRYSAGCVEQSPAEF
jgi:hypothetical protein